LRVHQFVKPLHLADGVALQRRFIKMLFPADDELAELRAPVADVVIGDDVVPRKAQQTRHSIADDGRTNVADVHRLSDIWSRVIDDESAWSSRWRDAEMLIAQRLGRHARDELRLQAKVDKTRPGDFRCFADAFDLQTFDELLRQRARILLQRFGKRQRTVPLIIAELRVGRRHDL
jgi:hypothetical protein